MHLSFLLKSLGWLLFFSLLHNPIFAQSFEEVYAQIVQEARLANYQNAARLSEEILPQASIKLGEHSLNFSNFLNNLAGFYEQLQKPQQALSFYEQVLAIRAKVLQPQHPEYLKSIHKLANIHFVLGNYEAAKDTYSLVFQANSPETPLPLPVLFNAYSNLGTLYYHQQSYAKADSLYEISKNYLSQIQPTDTLLQLIFLEKKAQLYVQQQQAIKTIEYYQKILPLQRGMYGQTHPHFLQTLYQALSYCNQLKEYALARTIFEQMPEILWQQIAYQALNEGKAALLEAVRAYIALNNPQRAVYFLKLIDKNVTSLPAALQGRYWHIQALLHQDQMKTAQVSQDFERAIQAYQSMPTLDSTRIENVYYEWAIWEDAQKNYTQAEKIWQLLYQHYATQETLPTLSYNLATTYYKNQQPSIAKRIYQTAYDYQQTPTILKASICLQLGRLAKDALELPKALQFYQEARKLWGTKTENELSEEYYEANLEEAEIYQQLHQYPQALDLLNALLSHTSSDTAQVAIRSQLAMVYHLSGQIAEAQRQYAQIATLLNPNQAQSLEILINTYNNLGNLYKNQGLYEEGEKLLSKAQMLCDTQPNTPPYLKMLTLHNLANLHRSLGKLTEAEALLKQAADLASPQSPSTLDLLPEVQLSQANLLRQKGLFSNAEIQYIQLLEVFKRQGSKSNLYQEAQRQIALLYLQTGRYPKAIERLEILAKANEEILLNDLSNELASAYQKVGRSTEAEALLISMITLRTRRLGVQHPDIAAAQDQLGHLYRERGNLQEAQRLFEIAYQNRLSALGADHPAVAISKNHLALIAEYQQDFGQAEALYLQSIAIIKEKLGEGHLFYLQALNNLATLYEKNNELQKAFSYYQAALDRLHQYIYQNIGILNEQEKKQFWEANQTLIDNFLSFTASLLAQPPKYGQPSLPQLLAEVLNLRLHTKGLLLNHTRKTQSDFVKQAQPQTKALYAEWQENREWLAHHLQQKSSLALQAKIDSIQKITENLEKELIIQSQDFASIFTQKTIDWRAIQKKLKPNEAALEMIRLPQYRQNLGYLAIIILPQHPEPIPCLLTEGEAMENNYWAVYKNSIRFQEKDTQSYLNYWQTIQTVLDQAQIKKLYFSADGIYHLINVAALYIPQENRYVDEKIDITQLTNLEVLLDKKTSKLKNATVSLWGRPSYSLDASPKQQFFKDLPFTEVEVTQIADLLKEKKWKVTLFTGEAAREQTLKTTTSPTILHLATHGYFEEAITTSTLSYTNEGLWLDPLLRSGLVWAGVNTPAALAPQEDGKLSALEVSQLALYQTHLVVLSACQTGLGKVESGEGVYGLQRAFQIAGAKQLLMSLWEVDDRATQQFMTFFYENLLNTQNSEEALKFARQQTRLLYPNPFYWAAFILLGQTE